MSPQPTPQRLAAQAFAYRRDIELAGTWLHQCTRGANGKFDSYVSPNGKRQGKAVIKARKRKAARARKLQRPAFAPARAFARDVT